MNSYKQNLIDEHKYAIKKYFEIVEALDNIDNITVDEYTDMVIQSRLLSHYVNVLASRLNRAGIYHSCDGEYLEQVDKSYSTPTVKSVEKDAPEK